MSQVIEDIRDRPYLDQEDILGLNFVRAPGKYLYRRHFRRGLRSHLMEVLNPEDVKKEKEGILINGLRWYPRAKPLRMLRIFRTKFNTLGQAEEEIRRVKITRSYLSPAYIALSEEFLVDYARNGNRYMLLCGLQEYVEGEILDPWGPLKEAHLVSLLDNMVCQKGEHSATITNQWIHAVREGANRFIGKVKQMIVEASHIPDLAGVGNLLLTRYGEIKLVDINNISDVSFGPVIKVDDRGYPVCDKSIEALALLEERLLGRSSKENDPVYKTFLDPKRMKEVTALAEKFQLSFASATPSLGMC